MKELCGSENPETGYRTHLLSAVCHELGITLAQQPVSGKTNDRSQHNSSKRLMSQRKS